MADLRNRSLVDKYISSVLTARATPDRETGASPIEVAKNAVVGSFPVPSDVTNFLQAASTLGDLPGSIELMKNMFKGIGQQIEDKPVSTLAAAALPEAGLQAYRNTVPLAVRTYLHNFIPGSPTFTYMRPSEEIHALASVHNAKNFALQDLQQARDFLSQARFAESEGRFSDAKDFRSAAPEFIEASRAKTIDQRGEANIRPYVPEHLRKGSYYDYPVKPGVDPMRGPDIDQVNLLTDPTMAFGKAYINPKTQTLVDYYKWWDTGGGLSTKNPLIVTALKAMQDLFSSYHLYDSITQKLTMGRGKTLLEQLQKSRPGYLVNVNLNRARTSNMVDRVAAAIGAVNAAKNKPKE